MAGKGRKRPVDDGPLGPLGPLCSVDVVVVVDMGVDADMLMERVSSTGGAEAGGTEAGGAEAGGVSKEREARRKRAERKRDWVLPRRSLARSKRG